MLWKDFNLKSARTHWHWFTCSVSCSHVSAGRKAKVSQLQGPTGSLWLPAPAKRTIAISAEINTKRIHIFIQVQASGRRLQLYWGWLPKYDQENADWWGRGHGPLRSHSGRSFWRCCWWWRSTGGRSSTECKTTREWLLFTKSGKSTVRTSSHSFLLSDCSVTTLTKQEHKQREVFI